MKPNKNLVKLLTHHHFHKSFIGSAVALVGLTGWALYASGSLPDRVPQPRTVTHGTSSADANTSPPTALGPLPYDMDADSTLKSSGKKVFAHYIPSFPISFDNKSSDVDYYAKGYLDPNGEGGIHAAYGGFTRDRPLPRAVDPSSDWRLDDMKTEVARASGAGLDGFTVDILGISGANWDRANTLLQAVSQTGGNFRMIPMPDGAQLGTADSDAVSLADAMAGWATGAYGNALYRLDDGRVVISPFDPEGKSRPLSFWQTFLSEMQTKGVSVAFVPCFLNYNANAAAYAPISYGFSNWGNRSPATNQNLTPSITDAHNRGKIWMQPVSTQDERPRSSIYDEANNSENLRTTWLAAINGGADWVQIPTWNDFAEGAMIEPTANNGWSLLDISGYYLQRFKQGAYPQIKRDVLYLSHRLQPVGATVTGPQTQYMSLRAGSSPGRDNVEVLSFLTAPASVTVNVGSTTQTYQADAGVFSKLVPLAAGSVSATINYTNGSKRTVTSPATVTSSPAIQDFSYRFSSSGRSGSDTSAPAQTPAPTAPSGAPDLIVTDLSWTPLNPKLGDDVTFNATIKNQGTAATPDGVIHGVAFLIGGKTVNWSDTYTSSIAPGGSVKVTANSGPNKIATWPAVAGDTEVTAFVDDINRIKNETDETNNKLSKTITVAAADGSGGGGGSDPGAPTVPPVIVPPGNPVVITPTTDTSKPLQVSGGTKITIPTTASGGGSVTVKVDGKPLDPADNQSSVVVDTSKLTNGQHMISVTNSKTGQTANQTIIVRNGALRNAANHIRQDKFQLSGGLLFTTIATVLIIRFHLVRVVRRKWAPTIDAVEHTTHLDTLLARLKSRQLPKAPADSNQSSSEVQPGQIITPQDQNKR